MKYKIFYPPGKSLSSRELVMPYKLYEVPAQISSYAGCMHPRRMKIIKTMMLKVWARENYQAHSALFEITEI